MTIKRIVSKVLTAADSKKSITVRQELKDEVESFSKEITKHFQSIMKKHRVDVPTQNILLEYVLKKVKQQS